MARSEKSLVRARNDGHTVGGDVCFSQFQRQASRSAKVSFGEDQKGEFAGDLHQWGSRAADFCRSPPGLNILEPPFVG
jgi:hypothetical protein